MSRADYERMSLPDLIFAVIDDYENDRADYWKDSGQEQTIKILDSIASYLLKASGELTLPPINDSLTWRQIRSIAEADNNFAELVAEKVQITLAWDFVTDVDGMAKRCVEMTREVLLKPPNETVLRFLRRVSRCYIAGFFPETVILCRGAIENAIVEKYAISNKPFPRVPEGKSETRARLDKAEDLQWISRRVKLDAWTVWKRGSKAAHEDPDACKAALETIELTKGFLLQLYS